MQLALTERFLALTAVPSHLEEETICLMSLVCVHVNCLAYNWAVPAGRKGMKGCVDFNSSCVPTSYISTLCEFDLNFKFCATKAKQIIISMVVHFNRFQLLHTW